MKTQRSNTVLIALGILALAAGLGLSSYLQFSALLNSSSKTNSFVDVGEAVDEEIIVNDGEVVAADDAPLPPLERGKVLAAGAYRYSGPYARGNLTVYLIHGQPTLADKSFLTLQEALEQKKIVVHETGAVNSLNIENVSTEEVFIQSGDVVKGGQQDRTFPYDFVVPARSGQLPLTAFCVEQNRWGQRGEESKEEFSSSSVGLATRKLKAAALALSQEDVWTNVAAVKQQLSDNLGQPVDSSESQSSYQLAVENRTLKDALKPYIDALSPAPTGKKDVLGVVVLVNGKVSSADVYASPRLFSQLWPKLVDWTAVEAFAELKRGQRFSTESLDEVKKLLRSAEQGTAKLEGVTRTVYVYAQESDKQTLFDTCDRRCDNLVLHRSVLTR
jgi:hypothetical protein